ncbi:MAG TPA: ASCH domain-containing protein [Tepidisphaeraceae bacterium]|jgi:hypothetical protein
MRALSIRQPYAELILRGVKTIEYRSRATKIIGERFYIYAALGGSRRAKAGPGTPGRVWSADVDVPRPADMPPGWMLELAQMLMLGELPVGVIVGSATIAGCRAVDDHYEWDLADVRRESTLRKPARHPQPSWFRPF